MICLICSGFRIRIISEDVAPSSSTIAPVVLRRVLRSSSLTSDPLGAGGSGVVVLGTLSSIKARSSPSASDERSRFSARGSMSFSFWVSVLSVC